MPTNANTFNSRVTSEALEAKFRQVFPSQGGAELGQDLFASGVIQPVIDFSTVAEGSVLPSNLQTAWDFATEFDFASGATTNIVSTPGFWQLDLSCNNDSSAGSTAFYIDITDGFTTKRLWMAILEDASAVVVDNPIVVFVRSGDTLSITSTNVRGEIRCWYRQIADVNGNLVNPLGFTFS